MAGGRRDERRRMDMPRDEGRGMRIRERFGPPREGRSMAERGWERGDYEQHLGEERYARDFSEQRYGRGMDEGGYERRRGMGFGHGPRGRGWGDWLDRDMDDEKVHGQGWGGQYDRVIPWDHDLMSARYQQHLEGDFRGLSQRDIEEAFRMEGGHRGKGPRSYRRSDERIRDDVCEILTYQHMLDASDIDVIVNNGEVTLRGEVHSRREKRAAEDLAERVRGIHDIHNELKVRRTARGEKAEGAEKKEAGAAAKGR